MAVNILYVVLYYALSLKLAKAISCFSNVASDTLPRGTVFTVVHGCSRLSMFTGLTVN